MQNVTKQTRIPANLKNPEDPRGQDLIAPPNAYNLLNLEAGSTLHFGRQPLSVIVGATNILNTRYRDYMNAFRYFADEPGANMYLKLKLPLIFGKNPPDHYEEVFQYTKTIAFFAAAAVLTFSACKKEKNEDPDHDHENENEEITTVKLTFTNAATPAEKVIATWKDLDGSGGTAPQITPIALKANTAYLLSTELLDERKNPADNVTGEIEEEADEHRIFHLFFVNANAPVTDSVTTAATVTPLDKDSKNLPVGLQVHVATKTAFTGYFRMVVRHQPTGKNGLYGPGSSDAQAEFPIEIK